MKKKIVGIFVMMLMIVTAIPIVGIENLGAELDQYSTEDSWGLDGTIIPGYGWAQSFIPTMKKLSRVEVKINKNGDPGMLSFAIRKILIDVDLVSENLANPEVPTGTNWLVFDCNNLRVTPGDTYYIVLNAERGFMDDYYQWRGTSTNPYARGTAWTYNILIDTWEERDIDFCFKTYGIKGLSKSEIINYPFLKFLENHPNLFPLLRHSLELFFSSLN
jgi:hypothetical protein